MLKFSDNFASASSSFYLMELPDELLKQVEADSSVRFQFKGREDEEAVLVTEDKTYSVRRGETSNAQMFFECSSQQLLEHCSDKETDQDKSSHSFDVVFQTGHVFELALTGPRLKPLPGLLSRCPYEGRDPKEGDDMSDDIDVNLRPTMDDLTRMLQASRREIADELKRIGALKINGRYCLLGQRYESNLMTEILANAVINGWSLDALSLSLLQSEKELNEYPAPVLLNFLSKFGKHDGTQNNVLGADAESMENEDSMQVATQVVALDKHKIVLARADELLAAFPPTSRLTLDEFLVAWRSMSPAGASVRFEDLRGRAVLEQRGPQTLVRPFSVDGLSSDPRTRFRQLFAQAPAWSREDLLPFVADLVGPGQSGDQLLLKHTRVTRSSGPAGEEVRMYSARV